MQWSLNAQMLPECSRGELIEDGGVAGRVIIIAVALSSDPQIVKIHRIQANNSWKKFVVGDVLGRGSHDFSALLIQSLITPVGINLGYNSIKNMYFQK